MISRAVCIFLFAMASGVCAFAAETEPFTIVAVLTDNAGKPLAGERVHCLVFQDGQSYAMQEMVDGRIVPGGPRSVSDKAGNVEIKVDGAFIERGMKEFTIGVVRDGKILGVTRDGSLFYFSLNEARTASNKLNLGKVVLRAK